MNTPYPQNKMRNKEESSTNTIAEETCSSELQTQTRLSCAKKAMEGMLCDLMLQSKSNEAVVLLLKTPTTRHHLCYNDVDDDENDDIVPFPNITELSPDGMNINGMNMAVGMTRPTVSLLRALRKVQAPNSNLVGGEGGDFCNGIIVAADALYKRTKNKQYRRRIVIFTDAAHEAMMDDGNMNRIIGGLRELECRLDVIGLDFTECGEFESALPEAVVKQEMLVASQHDTHEENDEHDDSDNDSSKQQQCDDEINEDGDEYRAMMKRENENLLVGIARLTGGSVVAAHDMKEILASTKGKRIPRSTLSKCIFHIAPSYLAVDVRLSLLVRQATMPRPTKEVLLCDPVGAPIKDVLGNDVTSKVKNMLVYTDPGLLLN